MYIYSCHKIPLHYTSIGGVSWGKVEELLLEKQQDLISYQKLRIWRNSYSVLSGSNTQKGVTSCNEWFVILQQVAACKAITATLLFGGRNDGNHYFLPSSLYGIFPFPFSLFNLSKLDVMIRVSKTKKKVWDTL